jgi:hypothetical protein
VYKQFQPGFGADTVQRVLRAAAELRVKHRKK